MNKQTSILIVLFIIVISGCVLTADTGKYPVPSNPARVYYWYADGTVSSGTSDNPTAYKTYYPYKIYGSKKIIATGIAKNDRVYYWYDDNTTSVGTTDDPTKYKSYYASNFESNRELIDAAIAGNDRIYYWYSGGSTASASIGTSNNPTKYKSYYQANILKSYSKPVGIGIDGFYDTVFYWYPDQTVSSGTSDNATKHKDYYNSNLTKEVVGIAIRNGK